MTKLSKYKGCEELSNWIKPCIRHLFWSATITLSGNGSVIFAKFKSFFQHVKNKHEGFGEPLFDKCIHDKDIPGRKWLKEGENCYICNQVGPRLVNGKQIWAAFLIAL